MADPGLCTSCWDADCEGKAPQASQGNGDLVDALAARRILGLGRSWFYAHIAPTLRPYPVDWRVKRRRREQMRRGRPTGCGKHLYSRREVEALKELRRRMLVQADTRYLPWLLVLDKGTMLTQADTGGDSTWIGLGQAFGQALPHYVPWSWVLDNLPASHREATASSAASQ